MFTVRKKKLSGNDLTDLAISIKFLFSSYVRLSVRTTKESQTFRYISPPKVQRRDPYKI